MQLTEIVKPNTEILKALQNKINQKTKPIGALGALEDLALRIGLIQQTLSPELRKPQIIIFAGDHGIALEGVSAYPQEVTHQMVMNFLYGGAAINVFASQNGIDLTVVDAGVNHDFGNTPMFVDAKVGFGTHSFLQEPAMSMGDCNTAMERGALLVQEVYDEGSNVIGFGEMGIGNSASASMLMHLFTQIPLEDCIGRGTGVDDTKYRSKVEILKRALNQNGSPIEALEVLKTYGGFEIAMMCGAMLRAAALQMTILVDGFIATAAYLAAFKIESNIQYYSVFCHQSEEKGHQKLLDYLKGKPILNLNMRLGEGTGCAVAYPVVQSAVNFLNKMASFESAGVSEMA